MVTKLASKKSIPGVPHVHIDRASGPQHVGKLVIDDEAPGGFAAKFRYAKSWLAAGFPIDPVNLPLRPGCVHTSSKSPSLGVLFDAGPDMWGLQDSRQEPAVVSLMQTFRPKRSLMAPRPHQTKPRASNAS